MIELNLVPITPLKAGLDGFDMGYKAATIVEYKRGVKDGVNSAEDPIMNWYKENPGKGLLQHQVEALFRKLKEIK